MIHSKIKVTWSSWSSSCFNLTKNIGHFSAWCKTYSYYAGVLWAKEMPIFMPVPQGNWISNLYKTLGPQESQTSSLHCPICHLAPANEQRLRVFSERDTLLPPRLLRASKPQLHEKPEVFICSLSSNWRRGFIWNLVTWWRCQLYRNDSNDK